MAIPFGPSGPANARLSDIAEQAGVSEATVSRVLNDRPGVAPHTRAAVLAALDILGYERPLKLRRRTAGLIGLITPELVNPIFPAFAQAISSGLTRHGWTTVLATQTPGGATEDELTGQLVDRGVAGIVFVSGLHADSTAAKDRYERLRARGVPFVMVNGFSPDVKGAFVSADDREAARLSVGHLADLGHRRIGLAVGQRRYVPVQRKIEGFLHACGELLDLDIGSVDDLVEDALYTLEGGRVATLSLLERGCTAVVCASDMMALGAIRAARERGLRVPRDVSVVGYDDSLLVALTDPPLTTVRQPVGPMSQAAVRTLLEEINGVHRRYGEIVFHPELVVRGSTSACPR